MAFTCDQCRARKRAEHPTTTATGRTLCSSCAGVLLAASASLIAGGDVGDAVATVGWYERVRRALGRG